MPWTQGQYAPPNNFVQQYDLGQKKIRADLVDQNFNDAASAINTLKTNIDDNDAAVVHLAGAETISGDKTFTGDTIFSGNLVIPASVVTDVAVALDGSNLTAITTVKTVVEAWSSGTEWYRVWSDGWIEQGGATATFGATDITVNFSKSFQNANCTVTFVAMYNANDMNNNDGWIKTKSATSFVVHAYATANKSIVWYACGY